MSKQQVFLDASELGVLAPLLEEAERITTASIDATDRRDMASLQRMQMEAMFKAGLVCGGFQTLLRLRGDDPADKFMLSPLHPEIRVEAEYMASSGKRLGEEWTS